jgi:probable phosphoglycerate mutase
MARPLSDLLRARQTAEHCARATALPVSLAAALRGQGYGGPGGRPSRERDPVDWTDPHCAANGSVRCLELPG